MLQGVQKWLKMIRNFSGAKSVLNAHLRSIWIYIKFTSNAVMLISWPQRNC